jgi:hypothetical protein
VPPFAEALTALRDRGFERLLDIPAVPGDDGWKIRRHDTGFRLLTPKWRRAGLSRVYSLGWGLTPSGLQGTVLLVEAHGVPVEDTDALTVELIRWFGELGHARTGGTWRLAASAGLR